MNELHSINICDIYRENIGATCFIIMRSIVWIAIKPCKCDWKSILPKVENVDRLTLCKALFNLDVDAKETLNRVLWKNN